jgi:hypothetical protein
VAVVDLSGMRTRREGGKPHVHVPFAPVARRDGWAVSTRYALWASQFVWGPLRIVHHDIGVDGAYRAAHQLACEPDAPPAMTAALAAHALAGVKCNWCTRRLVWGATRGTHKVKGKRSVLVWLRDADEGNLEETNLAPICWSCHQVASKPPIPRANNRFTRLDPPA